MQLRHLVMAVAGGLLIAGWVLAEEATGPVFEPYVGEVAVKTLNVRSGPSTNYYVVTRLKAGERVKVVGEESGWLAVVPPRGCFSLIAAEYVDRGDGVAGVVNATNVRVRAGSELSSDAYAVQCQLQRGALVKIIGPMDDRFLKIEPPDQATLSVSKQYIHRVPGAVLDVESAAGEPFDTPPGFDVTAPARTRSIARNADDLPAKTLDEVAAGGTDVGEAKPEILSASAEEYRRRLDAADVELNEELAKPLLHREFTHLLPRYRALAEQEVDPYTRAYARVRLQQIETANEMVEGLRKVRQLREDVRAVRKDALLERANLRPLPIRTDGGFDAEGELRPSAIYDSPVGPRRYRLVDSDSASPRTIGYVEIPPELDIDVTDFLGRRVGVRARERVLQTGDVNPINVYVAAELVVLDRAGSTDAIETVDVDATDVSASLEETTSASRP